MSLGACAVYDPGMLGAGLNEGSETGGLSSMGGDATLTGGRTTSNQGGKSA